MEKRVLLEKKGRNPSEIKELVLDNCSSTSITGLTDEFCNLETASMVNVGLTNLKGFPVLPKLRKLDLSNNCLSGGLGILSSSCPQLHSLHLAGNKIDSLETLEPLSDLRELRCLYLSGCGVTSTERYREGVFGLLPTLKYLDGLDKKEQPETENGKTDRWGSEGNEEDSDKDEDSEGESDDDDEEEELGLECLQEDIIDEESEGDDYTPEGEVSEDEDIEEDEDSDSPPQEETPRGEKRKLEESDD